MKFVYLVWEKDPLYCEADVLLHIYSTLEAANERVAKGSSYKYDLIIEIKEVEE